MTDHSLLGTITFRRVSKFWIPQAKSVFTLWRFSFDDAVQADPSNAAISIKRCPRYRFKALKCQENFTPVIFPVHLRW